MSEITTIYIVRHGETEWNIEHRLKGHQDSPLTELGIQQAEWLADALKDKEIDHVYSSSSLRAALYLSRKSLPNRARWRAS